MKIFLLLILLPIHLFSQQWFPMDVGVSNPIGLSAVTDINSFQGNIVITGHFKYSGTTVLNSVAQWVGSQWQQMGNGLYETGFNCGYGFQFAIYKSQLYLDGIFGAAGGFPYDYIHNSANVAKWDGVDWNKLTTDTMSGVDFICNSLYTYKNNLYIGGDFGIAFSTNDSTLQSGNIINAQGIAKWNDTSFTSPFSLFSDYGTHDFYLMAFTSYNNQLILGGFFTTIDTMPYGTYKFIAGWNDTSFIAYGTGFNSPVAALTEYNGELYAAGTFTATGDNLTSLNYVAKWNGTQWQQVGEGLNDTVFSLYVDSVTNKLYAGGSFTQTGLGIQAKHIAEWTGTNWQEVGGGTNGTVGAIYSKDSNLYVGGMFSQVGSSISANNIACWGHNPVAINELTNNEQINIYPNPVVGKLNVQANSYEQTEIILYDLSTRKLLQQIFTNSTTINTEQLAKGMYLYTVRNRNGIIKNGKVIKQ